MIMSGYMIRELTLCVIAFWAGARLSLVYDCLRILRKLFPHKGWLVSLEDMLFWLGTAVFLCVLLFQENSGALRIYLAGCVILGAAAWQKSLGPLFVRVFSFVLGKIRDFLCKILRIPLGIFHKTTHYLAKRLKFLKSRVRMILSVRGRTSHRRGEGTENCFHKERKRTQGSIIWQERRARVRKKKRPAEGRE